MKIYSYICGHQSASLRIF